MMKLRSVTDSLTEAWPTSSRVAFATKKPSDLPGRSKLGG